jgi:hypothetical protein
VLRLDVKLQRKLLRSDAALSNTGAGFGLVGEMKRARRGRGQNFRNVGFHKRALQPPSQGKLSIFLHLRSRRLLNGSLFEIQLTRFTLTSGAAE